MEKILIVNAVQFGYFTDTYYHALALKPYYDVTFLCYDQNKPKFDVQGIKVIYVQNKSKILRRLNFYKTVIHESRDYNLMTVSYFKSAFIIGLLSKPKLIILNIFTGNLSENNWLRTFHNLIIYFNCYFFDRITVLSKNLSDLLRLPSDKTFIVPVGAVTIDESQKKYDRISLLYLGTLSKRKIELTVEGFKLFCDKYCGEIQCHYDIIGNGDYKTENIIKQYITENGLQNFVKYLGRVPQSELPTYFNNATIGVCFVPQTPYYDCQPPTKLFEYAFSGLINIATSTKENKRFITSNNGVLCEDNSESFFLALEKIYRSLHNYNEQKIKASLSEYHWEQIIIEKLLPVLKIGN